LFPLTPQERLVLIFLIVVLLAGTVWRHACHGYPPLNKVTGVIDGAGMYFQIDLNTATHEELVGLPYIGEYTARHIIAYRKAHGPFHAVEEIKRVTGIKEKNYEKFAPFLKVSQFHE
jgi:competence ComEA-like helix-hairpin-helix protein